MIHASSWGEPERAMHCWFVMAHKPCTVSNSRNHHCMHVCCSMSVVSKTPCSQAASIYGENNTTVLTRYRWSVRTSTMATQTLGLNFTLKSWAESLALMSVDYAWPTELPEDSLVSSLPCRWRATARAQHWRERYPERRRLKLTIDIWHGTIYELTHAW